MTLDADVPKNRDFLKERNIIEKSNNIIFLPLEVEKGLFEFLKDHTNYKKFETDYSNMSTLTYDICFNDWPLEISSYKIGDIKKWYEYMTRLLGTPEILFKCWLDANEEKAKEFVKSFIGVYNNLSDLFEIDQIKDID